MVKQFKFWNTLGGWLVFAVAAITYFLTMEPTASFWDCGEFISSAAKLDVGHPPGAPFFMLMGHFFSLFASGPEQIAACVNALSVLASAFTILFLFWTITALAKKLVAPDSLWKQIGILAAGAVGALAYTFSDTFWFSAVEGEVYASSSLFTAVVFWLILKWDEHADEEGSDRWLIVIAYLMGLSIGVHLLNLLTIPAIGLVYYFRRYEFKWWSFFVAFLASCAVLLFILYGIIPGFPTLAGWFELLFVNDFGCAFNSGLAFYIVLLIVSLVWAIVETYLDKSKVRIAISFTLAFALSGAAFLFESWIAGLIISVVLLSALMVTRNLISSQTLNTVAVMIAVILIGYSSYTALVIRSNAQPPMDQNSPNNVFSLKYYLNREQYGDRPLFYGQYYNAPVKIKQVGRGYMYDYKEGAVQYMPAPHVDGKPDQYIESGRKFELQYQPEFCSLFPRMYSSDGNHVKAYKSWTGMRDYKDAKKASDYGKILRENGNRKVDIKPDYVSNYVPYDRNGRPYSYDFRPTFGDNLKFFFSYQCHFMYWRYFMWNFVGRQNDLQSYGDITKGQWISGIPFIDNARLGDQSKLPKELLENKGHNVYFFLPLILGIIGIFWQVSRRGDKHAYEGARNFTLTFLLFFLTGLAIVIYLNQTPYQPRERDYAYAGSFYAFCIWIGMGALALIDLLVRGSKKFSYRFMGTEFGKKPSVALASVLTLACLFVPVWMAYQNWDDHDRSKRYVCRDFGANYLKSCEPGGILFSNGDNDTFPLWYNQEVEGVGDSLRVCNLSYLSTDWYISQMKRPYYHSEGLPISWKYEEYMANTNSYVRASNLRDTVSTDNAMLNVALGKGMPGRTLYVNAPDSLKAKFAKKNGYTETDFAKIDPMQGERVYISHKDRRGEEKDGYIRSELMVLEMLTTNKWNRPMYFCTTVGNDYYLGLEPYMELTGLAYQITPFRSRDGQPRINTEKMYNNMMNKFRYGNVKAHGIYLDENTMRMCDTHRYMFTQLAEQLTRENKLDSAVAVLTRCDAELPSYNVPYTGYYAYMMCRAYLNVADKLMKAGRDEEAEQMVNQAVTIAENLCRNIAEYSDYVFSLSKDHLTQIDLDDIGNKAQIAYYAYATCQSPTEYLTGRRGYGNETFDNLARTRFDDRVKTEYVDKLMKLLDKIENDRD